MKTGRPSKFTPALAAEICDLIANGLGLREICRREGMVPRETVMQWLDKHEDFRIQYARARDLQADHFAEEIVEISDDGTNDWAERQGSDGRPVPVVDSEHINRSRLRVDTRKWLMSKLAPKKYGDKLLHAGADGDAIKHSVEIVIVDKRDEEGTV